MSRKKRRLWLNKPKRISFKATKNKYALLTESRNLHCNTPPSSKKHQCTPSKVRTPKRKKLSSYTNNDQHSPTNFQSPSNFPHKDNESKHISESDSELFRCFFAKMQESEYCTDFTKFMKSVVDDSFPLHNLSFVLFMETVRFFCTTNTSEMRYSDTSKLFWKTGYRLFHAKFLYFMGGPKNIGQMSNEQAETGTFNPKNAQINFAVPSIGQLTEFRTSNVHLKNTIPPGILFPVIDALKSSDVVKDNEYMLCADAKKVTAGIDTKGGDVDMFGHERGEKLTERKEKLSHDVEKINEIKSSLCMNDDFTRNADEQTIKAVIPQITDVVQTISSRLQDTRDLVVRQTFGLNKFKGMGGDNWKESRYVYVISGLQASLYRLSEFSRDALTTIGHMLSYSSYIQQSISPYAVDNQVDFSVQQNIAMLRESTGALTEIEPRYVKQRSDIWFEVRKQACVTGSTLHSAIGLRGLKEKQNHFTKFIENVDSPISEEIQTRLSHGTKHENDAVATLVGRFLPAYYPNAIFVEEGCYVLPADKADIFCVVSPDGSIRASTNNKVIAAVEIKCPFPSEKQTPVHYSLPDYYVCQCLAEMFVLNTDRLLYVTYSGESTTFFNVTFSQDLWDCIWNQTLEDYDRKQITKPTRNGSRVKEIRRKIKEFTLSNVEFLCEIPSCTAIADRLPTEETENKFYLRAKRDLGKQTHCESHFTEILHILDDAVKVIKNGYDILRQRATEIMVWVITNKNRDSSTQMPCSLPIAYGLKDYKLTSDLMRSATDHVLKECAKHGIRVLSFATDGQWIQLMNRDSMHKPLTIYQFQKDFWESTKHLSKNELVKKITEINKSDPECPLEDKCIKQRQDGVLEVSTVANSFSAIATPVDRRVWCKSKDTMDVNNSEKDLTSVDQNWLPDSVVNELNTEENDIVRSIITEVSNEFRCSETTYEKTHIGLDETNRSEIEVDFAMNETGITSSQASNDKECDTEESGRKPESVQRIKADETLFSFILEALKTDQSTLKRWEQRSTDHLKKYICSVTALWELTHTDLNVIYKSIEHRVPKTFKKFGKSWKKNLKVDYLAELFGLITVPTQNSRVLRLKSPSSLKQLSTKVIQSKRYPKLALRSAYAKYLFPFALLEWQSEKPFSSPMQVEGIAETIPFWFSYPENNTASGSLLCKSIDCSHNLTHLRVRTSTVGFCGISSQAWRECAKSNETSLTLPFVEDLIDKQSVPNARTHFSEEVETWMNDHGFSDSAALTKIVREWYDACDTPGISAIERIGKLLSMRKLLLKDVDFSCFPPHGRYLNGTPAVTFEGMLIDIDTKIQMHNLTNSFNIRSIGSLAAETTVGILQSLYPTSQVSIKARDVPSLMSSVVDVMSCKSNPNRGFHMRTSRTSGIYPSYDADSSEAQERQTIDSINKTTIVPRDHAFDLPRKKTCKRNIKFGKVSGPQAPSRGALPVRQYHKTDESKILPTKRLGIEI